MNCDKELLSDEIAIYKKLVNRGAERYLCIDCLAEYFKCSRKAIKDKIDYYRKSGECTLFR